MINLSQLTDILSLLAEVATLFYLLGKDSLHSNDDSHKT